MKTMINHLFTSKKLLPTIFISVTRIGNAYLSARKAEKKVREFENHIFSTFKQKMEYSRRQRFRSVLSSAKAELHGNLLKPEVFKVDAKFKTWEKQLNCVEVYKKCFSLAADKLQIAQVLRIRVISTCKEWKNIEWQWSNHNTILEFFTSKLSFDSNCEKIQGKVQRLNDFKLKVSPLTKVPWWLEAEWKLTEEGKIGKNLSLNAKRVLQSPTEKQSKEKVGIQDFHSQHAALFHWNPRLTSGKLMHFIKYATLAIHKVCEMMSVVKVSAFAALRASVYKHSTEQPNYEIADLILPEESGRLCQIFEPNQNNEIERGPSSDTNSPHNLVDHEVATKECIDGDVLSTPLWEDQIANRVAVKPEPGATVEDGFVSFSSAQSQLHSPCLQKRSITEDGKSITPRSSQKSLSELADSSLKISTSDCVYYEWTDELNSKPELTPEEGDLFFSFLGKQAETMGRPIDGECWKLYAFRSPVETKQLLREANIMAGIVDAAEHESAFENASNRNGSIIRFSRIAQKPNDGKKKQKITTKRPRYSEWWEAQSWDEECIGVKDISPTAEKTVISTSLRETESSAVSVERHLCPKIVQFADYHDPEDIIPQIYGTRMFSYLRMFDKCEPPNAVGLCEGLQKQTLPLKSCLKQNNSHGLLASKKNSWHCKNL